jgi:methionyl-tRNA formyltransferase
MNNLNTLQGKNLIFADGLVGLEIFRYLLNEYKNDICGVVVTSKNEIYELAKSNGIQAFIFEDTQRFASTLPSNVEIAFLSWWPSIIKGALLDLPNQGFVNTHPSLLPHNRGKNPNFWCIVEQRPFGVSLHKIDAGIDSGPIIAQKEIAFDWTDTGESLYKKGQKEMLNLFKESYPKIRLNIANTSPQQDLNSFHYSRDMVNSCVIDLEKSYLAKDLFNLLRAKKFNSHQSCTFIDNNEVYEVSITIKRKI